MIEIKEKNKCCGCHACFNICPKNAITMEEDEKGFRYPVINGEKCINCGLCEKVCPILNDKQNTHEIKAYACINKNDEVRKNSSSGGIFTILAEHIIDKGGTVYGAKFDDEFLVEHGRAVDKEGIQQFKGAKYLQSRIGQSYREVKKDLIEGKYVLFSGTPCQIEGLKSYLGKEYERLYLQDIICHGVPSPIVWKKYINYISKNKKIHKVYFRNKEDGWKGYHVSIQGQDIKYKEHHSKDLYMRAFLKDICLRDSCYNCSFKKKNRNSDITLADFWGIQNVMPEFDDDKGTSLVIVNSEKGKKIFEEIKENMRYAEVDFETAIKHNSSMVKSVDMPKQREEFFKNIENDNIENVIKRYLPKEKFSIKVKRKCKALIKRSLKLVGIYK